MHPGQPRRSCDACAPAPRPVSIICKACGQEAPVPQRGAVPKYCSYSCKDWASKHPGQLRRPPSSCPGCGTHFPPSRGRRYCSKLCGEIARGEIFYGPKQQKVCAVPECGRQFIAARSSSRCCSERCMKRLYNRESRADGRQKPDPWSDRRRENYHRRRALKKDAETGAAVVFSAIAERDRWRCGICGKAVRRGAGWPHPKSPSLDHIVPLTKGGRHSPDNVQLAHLGCNTSKGNRGGGEQLLLIG